QTMLGLADQIEREHGGHGEFPGLRNYASAMIVLQKMLRHGTARTTAKARMWSPAICFLSAGLSRRFCFSDRPEGNNSSVKARRCELGRVTDSPVGPRTGRCRSGCRGSSR